MNIPFLAQQKIQQKKERKWKKIFFTRNYNQKHSKKYSALMKEIF